MIGTLLLVQHLAVYGGCAAWLLMTADGGAERRARLGWMLLSVAAFVAVWFAVDPRTIPVEWLWPVREGSTDLQVRVALGAGGDVGVAHSHGYVPWFGDGKISLDAFVRMNLALVAGTAVWLWGLGSHVIGSRTVALWVLGAWIASFPVWAALWGSGPASALWPALVVGGLGLSAWSAGGATRMWVPGALVSLGAASIVASMRAELVVLWVFGAIGSELNRRELWPMLAGWAATRRRSLAAVAVGGLALSALTYGPVTSWILTQGKGIWFWSALHPLDVSAVTLPVLGMSMVSPGLLVVAAAGVWRHPRATAGVALGLVFVLRLYHSAAHGGFVGSDLRAWPLEMVRYASYVAPVWLALAWWGLRGLTGRWRWGALLAVWIPSIPAVWPAVQVEGEPASMWSWRGGVVLDNQVEVRGLVHGMRAWPECGFAAALDPSATSWMVWRSTWGALRWQDRRARVVSGPLDLAAWAAAWDDPPECFRIWRGTVCNPVQGRACEALDLLEPVEVETVHAVHHAHPDHRWTTSQPMQVGWFSEGLR